MLNNLKKDSKENWPKIEKLLEEKNRKISSQELEIISLKEEIKSLSEMILRRER